MSYRKLSILLAISGLLLIVTGIRGIWQTRHVEKLEEKLRQTEAKFQIYYAKWDSCYWHKFAQDLKTQRGQR